MIDDSSFLAACARAGGPLPKFPAGNLVADRFWIAYRHGEAHRSGAGPKGSVGARAFRAGLARRKAEPGIDPAMDPRARRDVAQEPADGTCSP